MLFETSWLNSVKSSLGDSEKLFSSAHTSLYLITATTTTTIIMITTILIIIIIIIMTMKMIMTMTMMMKMSMTISSIGIEVIRTVFFVFFS